LFKREVRILGLSASGEEAHAMIIIGVVFRGSLWFDGMITCKLESNQKDYLQLLTKQIIHSKQYSQLRVVILSKQITTRLNIDIAALAKSIKLPVISIVQRKRGEKLASKTTKGRESKESGLHKFRVHGDPVFVRVAGIDVDRARQVFEVGRIEPYRVPEAVRVADLIAKCAHIAT
jgi:endonuclease V-like protein UPF0215 family